MIQARSPFFHASFALAVFLGIGIAFAFWTKTPPDQALESWAKAPSYRNLHWLGWGMAWVAGLPLAVIGLLEHRINRGWEPEWLRKMHSGCKVLDIYRSEDDPPGYQRIEVRNQKGEARWFVLDPSEVGLCEPDDIVHIWAIGKQVAHIAVVKRADPNATNIPNPPGARFSEKSQGGAELLMLFGPTVAGMLVGKGIEHLISGEMKLGGSFARMKIFDFRRYPRLETPDYVASGWGVTLVAVVLLLIGIAAAGWMLYAWLSGWEDTELYVSPQGDPRPGSGQWFRDNTDLWN